MTHLSIGASLCLILGLSMITVVGDAMVKIASLREGWSGWWLLLIGATIHGSTAVGWFFVMRVIKLSTIGVLYSVSVVVFLAIVSVYFFRETVTPVEGFGFALAIASFILLARFA